MAACTISVHPFPPLRSKDKRIKFQLPAEEGNDALRTDSWNPRLADNFVPRLARVQTTKSASQAGLLKEQGVFPPFSLPTLLRLASSSLLGDFSLGSFSVALPPPERPTPVFVCSVPRHASTQPIAVFVATAEGRMNRQAIVQFSQFFHLAPFSLRTLSSPGRPASTLGPRTRRPQYRGTFWQ